MIRPPFEQISPDKNVNCPCTTVSFTVSRESGGFVVLCQLALEISAFYDISVRRLAGLPPASDRQLPRGFALALGALVVVTRLQ